VSAGAEKQLSQIQLLIFYYKNRHKRNFSLFVSYNNRKIKEKLLVMANECKLLGTCGFFRKFNESKNLACKGFILMYCKGDKMDECKRLEYRELHGIPPSDDMMPSGQKCVI
jgi:hypothetical protein